MSDDDDMVNDLDELRRIAGSASIEPIAWDTPPPELWDRIADVAFGDRDIPVGTPVVTSIDAVRRRRPTDARWRLPLAAAAAVVVVIGVGIVAWRRPTDVRTVVADANLELLGNAGEGTAELVERNGTLQLRLATSGLEEPDGFTEVWLINTDLTELVSLGPIRDDGTYDLPAGLDPAQFPIVDVSFEPLDGDPQHSGNSVLRGELTF
jgi:anti-sigma-K factor RskA